MNHQEGADVSIRSLSDRRFEFADHQRDEQMVSLDLLWPCSYLSDRLGDSGWHSSSVKLRFDHDLQFPNTLDIYGHFRVEVSYDRRYRWSCTVRSPTYWDYSSIHRSFRSREIPELLPKHE